MAFMLQPIRNFSDRYVTKAVTDVFAQAGIAVNGPHRHDITVHNPEFFTRVFRDGSLGLGESYVDGWWDCAGLDEMFFRLFRSDQRHVLDRSLKYLAWALYTRVINRQSRTESTEVIRAHYDLPTEIYESFLGRTMLYTCAYFQDDDGLDEAQERKCDLICRKLRLNKDDRVLDLGCGWGGFAKYAASKVGCKVVGINLAGESVRYARNFTKGLPVEFRHQDYRDLAGHYNGEKFTKILVLGMLEHAGYQNYRTFMNIIHERLEDDGLFLLHTIGRSVPGIEAIDPWIEKYIFPNGMITNKAWLRSSSHGVFDILDWQELGSSNYDRTLQSWNQNFEANREKLKQLLSERELRVWRYYLLSAAAYFRAGKNDVWQLLMCKEGANVPFTIER